MKILLLARSLDAGGAQRQIALLARGLRKAGHEVSVAVYYSGGAFEADLHEANVRIVDLEKRGRWQMWSFLRRLARTISLLNPDVVYAFLTGPGVATALVRPWVGRARIVWGVRASSLDLDKYGWHVRLMYWLACRLSRFADLIICNSTAGMRDAGRNGFPAHKMIVIRNGVDVDQFAPDTKARTTFRRELGIGDAEILIGLVARLDPMKDHPTFIRAAALLAKERADVRFVCVGDGPEPYKRVLRKLADTPCLSERMIWTGSRSDMPSVYAALDLLVSSSSFGEGFPNVVGEAMASGVPCLVTNVGDSAEVVGDTGEVVPPRRPDLLYQGMLKLVSKLGKRSICTAARERVRRHHSVESMTQSTVLALEAAAAGDLEVIRGWPQAQQ